MPAQNFVRSTIRNDNKLSDRSISGILVGISDKGNGYIFLTGKSNTDTMKELELLTACSTLDASNVLLPFLTHEKE